MKSEELMIGDLIHCITDNKTHKIFRLNLEDDYLKDGELYKNEENKLNYLFDVEPIPLTTEMLLANGFERNEHFDYNSCTFFSFPTGIFTKRSGFGIEKRNDEYYITDHALMPMRYVHELQHALRLCGLNELANNFKI